MKNKVSKVQVFGWGMSVTALVLYALWRFMRRPPTFKQQLKEIPEDLSLISAA